MSTAFPFTAREFSNVLALVAHGATHPALSPAAITPAARAAVQKAAAYQAAWEQDHSNGWTMPGHGFLPANITAFTINEAAALLAAAALVAADPALCADLNLEGQATALKVRAYQQIDGQWAIVG